MRQRKQSDKDHNMTIFNHLNNTVLLMRLQIQQHSFLTLHPVLFCSVNELLLLMSIDTHTHPHTNSPQTLYSSGRGSHHRRCRWNTPPSPDPSAQCRRSGKQHGSVCQVILQSAAANQISLNQTCTSENWYFSNDIIRCVKILHVASKPTCLTEKLKMVHMN